MGDQKKMNKQMRSVADSHSKVMKELHLEAQKLVEKATEMHRDAPMHVRRMVESLTKQRDIAQEAAHKALQKTRATILIESLKESIKLYEEAAKTSKHGKDS
jgi:hypothetical protein